MAPEVHLLGVGQADNWRYKDRAAGDHGEAVREARSGGLFGSEAAPYHLEGRLRRIHEVDGSDQVDSWGFAGGLTEEGRQGAWAIFDLPMYQVVMEDSSHRAHTD